MLFVSISLWSNTFSYEVDLGTIYLAIMASLLLAQSIWMVCQTSLPFILGCPPLLLLLVNVGFRKKKKRCSKTLKASLPSLSPCKTTSTVPPFFSFFLSVSLSEKWIGTKKSLKKHQLKVKTEEPSFQSFLRLITPLPLRNKLCFDSAIFSFYLFLKWKWNIQEINPIANYVPAETSKKVFED